MHIEASKTSDSCEDDNHTVVEDESHISSKDEFYVSNEDSRLVVV